MDANSLQSGSVLDAIQHKLITKSITETLITMIAVKKGDRFASKSGNIVNISNIVFTTDKAVSPPKTNPVCQFLI